MSITRVQSNTASAAARTVTITLPSGVTLGNLLVVMLGTGTNNDAITPPDSSWQLAVNQAGGTGEQRAAIYYLLVDSAHAGGTSWTWTDAISDNITVAMAEWNSSTGWQASPVDQTATNTSTSPSTTIDSGTTATTTQPTELWVAHLAYGGGAAQTESGLTSGWTDGQEVTNSHTLREAYQVVAAVGAAHCSFTITTAEHWGGAVATFLVNPALAAAPTSLSFSATQGGGNPGGQNDLLSETAGAATAWTSAIIYGSGSGWLSLSPTSGSLAANGNTTLSVSCATGALTAGTYTATITITATTGGATAQIAVTFTVTGASSSPGTYYPSVVLPDAPSVYYRFDESGGVVAYDASGDLANGTYNGPGVTYGTPGAITGDGDTAVTLNGTSAYIACPAQVNPSGQAVSVEAWVSLSNTSFITEPTVAGNAVPISSSSGFSLWLDSTGGGVHFTVGNGSTYADAHAPLPLIASAWYHLVGNWNGITGVVSLYVNGILKASATLFGSLGAAANSPIFGHNPAASSDYLPGAIDEGAIYPSCLSAARVLTHYVAGARGQPSAVVFGSILDLHVQKIQVVKVYDPNGNFLGIWNDAPRMTGWKQTINCADGQVKLVLPRKIDNFDGQGQSGSSGTVALMNQVQIWLYGPGLPASGLLKFNGFIDAIEPSASADHSETVTVTLTPYSAAIGDHGYGGTLSFTNVDAISGFWDYWFNTTDPVTGVSYTSPLVQAAGNPGSFGTQISYQVQALDLKSIFDTAIAMLGPSTYFWRPNSDNTVTLAQFASAAQHQLTLGKHLQSLSYSIDNTQRKNVVVFVGSGTIVAIAVGPSAKPPSQGGIGERILMQQDSRVTDQATANLLAHNLLVLYDRPTIRAKARVVDYRGDISGLGYDIESLKTGDMVTLLDNTGATYPSVWGQFVWGQTPWGVSGGAAFYTIIPIVAITYNWDTVDLEIGTLQPSQDRQIAALQRKLGDYTVGQ